MRDVADLMTSLILARAGMPIRRLADVVNWNTHGWSQGASIDANLGRW
jgi:hypothetical protein